MCPASRSSVCTRWVRLLKALASSMTRIGLPSLHDRGANLIPGDPPGWEPHDRAECPPALLGHDRESTHYPRSRHRPEPPPDATTQPPGQQTPPAPPCAQPTSPHHRVNPTRLYPAPQTGERRHTEQSFGSAFDASQPIGTAVHRLGGLRARPSFGHGRADSWPVTVAQRCCHDGRERLPRIDGSGTSAHRTGRNGRSWTGASSPTDHPGIQAAVKMTPTATISAGATTESRRPASAQGDRSAVLQRSLPVLQAKLGC